jgi:hypothetical protein
MSAIRGVTVYIVFDFDDERLLDKANPVRLLKALAAAGWRFLKKAVVCDEMPGDVYVPPEPALLARAWDNAIRAAPRYGNGCWMEADNPDGFRLSFGLYAAQPRRLFLAADKNALGGSDKNADSFAGAAEIAFAALSPAYGFGLFNYDAHDLPAVGAGIRALWDYTFLGAALVEQVGNAALDAIDAHRNVRLDDGGRLLQMMRNPVIGLAAAAERYRQGATALGLSQIRQGG